MTKIYLATKDEVLPRNIEVDVLRSIVVLLVNIHGTSESVIHRYLQPLDGHTKLYQFYQSAQQTEPVTYYIGKCGACPIAFRWLLSKSQASHDHSIVVMMADQCFPNLGAIISVGVAYGIKKKAQLCDVLVSSKILNYDYDITVKKYLPKGEATALSTPVVKLFTQRVQWPSDEVNKHLEANRQRIPNVKSGVIMSGPHVVNDPAISGLVRNFADGVIGIEMGGANVFAEKQHFTIHTIIVNAVCDFGDGKSIEGNHPFAALLAANLVHTGLSHPQAREILQG